MPPLVRDPSTMEMISVEGEPSAESPRVQLSDVAVKIVCLIVEAAFSEDPLPLLNEARQSLDLLIAAKDR